MNILNFIRNKMNPNDQDQTTPTTPEIEVLETAIDPKGREVTLIFDYNKENWRVIKCGESFEKLTEESALSLFNFLSHDTQAFATDINE